MQASILIATQKMAHKSPVYSQIKGQVNILFLHSCLYLLLCHLKMFVCLIKLFCCCCSVVRLCPTLSNSMDHSTSGSSVFHYLPDLLKFMSVEAEMLSNHLILCCPLLLLPSIFSSIRVFSNELALCIRWPKYWSFSFSNTPSNEYSGLISFRIDWLISLQSRGLSRVFSSIIRKHQLFNAQPSLWSNSHICT